MGVSTVSFILALLAAIGTIFLIWVAVMAVFSFVSESVRESLTRMRQRATPYALFAAWVVAALATLGSLYYSEVAHFEPCRLCWFQRIAMYPLVVILAIAGGRRDIGVRWYAVPVAAIGALIAGYHYFLEWFPAVDIGACTMGIPCTLVWFRELGFVSLPYLALTAFLLVIVFLLIPLRREPDPD